MGPSSKASPWQATSSNSRLINYFGVAVEGGLMSKWPWAVISASPRLLPWHPGALEMPLSLGLPFRAELQIPGWGWGRGAALDKVPALARQGLLSCIES